MDLRIDTPPEAVRRGPRATCEVPTAAGRGACAAKRNAAAAVETRAGDPLARRSVFSTPTDAIPNGWTAVRTDYYSKVLSECSSLDKWFVI